MSARADGGLAELVARGVSQLLAQQLPSGELPTYRRIPTGGKLYAPSPCLAALMHDALAPLDPGAPEACPAGLATLAPAARLIAQRGAAWLRTRLRRFLAWQEEADGVWRFYGRASALPPDAVTSACALAALRDAPGVPERLTRHAAALQRFRQADGTFATYVEDGRAFAWIDDDGRRLPGVEPLAQAHVLRALALAGAHDDALLEWVCTALEAPDLDAGSREQPDPIFFVQAVARAWAQAGLPERKRIAARCLPFLLARRHDDGGFGGDLRGALACRALLDLGYEGDALDAPLRQLRGGASSSGEWPYEPFLAGGHGSSAFTTAFALGALVAGAARRGSAP